MVSNKELRIPNRFADFVEGKARKGIIEVLVFIPSVRIETGGAMQFSDVSSGEVR